jgi:hypothetical protein
LEKNYPFLMKLFLEWKIIAEFWLVPLLGLRRKE